METTQNSILFKNIYKDGGVSINDTLIQSSFNPNENIPSDSNFPLINAVDIDWNGAEIDSNTTINTTGDLISWIKNNQLNNEQKEALQYLSNIIKMIKNNGNINSNDTYFWYVGLTLPTANNIKLIALGSSNLIEHWDGKEFFVKNTTSVATPVYICTPVDFNIAWKDPNGFDINLPEVTYMKFTLNNVEYKVQKKGRDLSAGAEFLVCGYN